MDDGDQSPTVAAAAPGGTRGAAPPVSKLAALQASLAALQKRYGDGHPEIRKLKQEIADEEAGQKAVPTSPAPAVPAEIVATATAEPAPAPRTKRAVPPPQYVNPILQSQLKVVDDEVAKHKVEQQRLNKLAAGYQAKLEAIPVREQQIANVVRDYEISKAHYSQLLDKQLSAETATQLEIRQKGEKFSILDPAQPAERPSSPNRPLINAGGAIGGLGLGLFLALVTEFMGMSITTPEQVAEATGSLVLEVIPVIRTYVDRRARKRRLLLAGASFVITILVSGAVLFYHYRT
jgi:succinoglycan biosynthesis transport protein ExoP